MLGGLARRTLDGNFDNISRGVIGGAVGGVIGGLMGRAISTAIFAVNGLGILFAEAAVQVIGVSTCICALIGASRCAETPLWRRKATILPY
ncbi:MAG: hypothetical protein LBS87_01710 [Puniceicoccales bacterium]|jgi:hypothetical protein|nr:hypothetical protein [Puniceicoccales bacterium]